MRRKRVSATHDSENAARSKGHMPKRLQALPGNLDVSLDSTHMWIPRLLAYQVPGGNKIVPGTW